MSHLKSFVSVGAFIGVLLLGLTAHAQTNLLGSDPTPDIVVSGDGSVPVSIFDGATSAPLGGGFPFGPFPGGARMAVGDLTGDGVADLVAGMGPGGSLVSVFNGATITPLGGGYPFGAGFGGGVYVALGDVNGDGRNDIAVSQGPGGGGVRVFSGLDYGLLRDLAPFGAGYAGGVSVAMGDITGDGRADLVLGQLTGSVVVLVDGATGGVLASGVPFGGGGVHVAAGDVTGDGRADAIVAPATGGGTVLVFNVATLSVVNIFQPFGGAFSAGLRVAATDLDGDGRADIIVGPGAGGGNVVRAFSGATYAQIRSFSGYAAGYNGGIFVAAPAATATRFTSAASATFTVGTPGTFTVTTGGSAVPPALSSTGTLPPGVTFVDNGNGTATLSGTPTGTGGAFALTFTATAGAGAPAQQSFTLTVNRAPAITSAAATSFPVGAAGSFSVTATGFPAPTLSVTGALPAGVTFAAGAAGTATLSGTPAPGTAGTYPLTLNASNGVGTAATQAFVLTVTEGLTITSAASATFQTGQPGTFTVTTAGSPAATTISTTGPLPAGVTLVNQGNGTATLSGTPGGTSGGSYAFTITASNGSGTPATQAFTLTVNQAPAVTSLAATTFTVGTPGSFQVTTTGYPAATVSATGTLPPGVTFTPNSNGTATIAGTPTGTGGVFALTISAGNGVGTPASQPFTLTVNAAPAVTSATGASFSIGQANSFTITTTGYPAATLVRGGVALPTGVTFVDNGNGTGTLAGNPAGGTSGSYALTFTASNGVGSPAVQNFTLTVGSGAIAGDDAFNGAVGNTQFVVGGAAPGTPAVVIAGSVLTNDSGTATLTAGPALIASTQGGSVAMASNGSFVYTPPVGFTGPSDTFTYTLTDGASLTDTAVVTINLAGIVWYVDDVAPGGDGRSQAPLPTLAAAQSAATAGQTIYVHPGTHLATTLRANEVVHGAGMAFTLGSLSIAATSNPVLTGTLTLGGGSATRGLTVNGGAGIAIDAVLAQPASLESVSISAGATGLRVNGAGGLTVVGGTFSGVSGAEVAIEGGTGTVAIGAAITNTAGRAISVTNKTAGTATFSGAIVDTGGTGVLLNANTGAAVAFTGGLSLTTGVNQAFTATNGGTVTATQDNTTIVNAITTTDGAALIVTDTEIGSAGLTFRSITAGTAIPSAGVAIYLENTGLAAGNGGLTVTGNGTAQSGGLIRRKTGADGSVTSGVGIFLHNTKAPSFSWIEMSRFDNSAIAVRNVAGFTLHNSLVTNAGSMSGEAPIMFGLPNPGGINGLVTGTTASIVDSQVSVGHEHNIAFHAVSGTTSLLISRTTPTPGDCQVALNSASTGGSGVYAYAQGAGTVATVNISQCQVRDNRLANVTGFATDSATLTLTVNGSEIVRGGDGVLLTTSADGHLNGSVTSNDIVSFAGAGVRVGQVSGNASSLSLLNAVIEHNNFDSTNSSTGSSVTGSFTGTIGQEPVARLRVANNGAPAEGAPEHFRQEGALPGISIGTPDVGTTPKVDLTIVGNHVDLTDADNPGTPGVRAPYGIELAVTYGTTCANVTGNLSHWVPVPVGVGGGIRAQQSGSGIFELERGVEPLATAAATVLQTNNSTHPVAASQTTVAGSLVVVENGTCVAPVW